MKSKSCVWLALLSLCFAISANAQMLKVEGGVAFPKLRMKGFDGNQLFDKSVVPFQMAVGLEYLDRGTFNLSSSIGYLRSGGKYDVVFNPVTGENASTFNYKYFIDYLTVNTLFNIKRSVRRETYYIGVGPRLDFKIGSKETEFEGVGYNGQKPEMNAVVFGLKCEAGFWYALDDRFRLGANVSYLPSFTKAGRSPVDPDITMSARSFTLGISFGYVL